MAAYRLFHFDNGRLVSASSITADNDLDAVRQCWNIERVDTAELWCSHRKVLTFPRQLAAATPVKDLSDVTASRLYFLGLAATPERLPMSGYVTG